MESRKTEHVKHTQAWFSRATRPLACPLAPPSSPCGSPDQWRQTTGGGRRKGAPSAAMLSCPVRRVETNVRTAIRGAERGRREKRERKIFAESWLFRVKSFLFIWHRVRNFCLFSITVEHLDWRNKYFVDRGRHFDTK